MSIACSREADPETDPTSPASSAAGTTEPDEPPCTIESASTAPKESESEDTPVSPVTDVRYSESDGCPRIVFEFEDQVSNYKIDYIEPPITDCGEGKEISTASWNAGAILGVELTPSGGPDQASETGEPSYKGPRDIAVDGKILKHLKVVCDFEGHFDWIIGLDAKHPFEVVTFEDETPRLVIDISEV
jgi:hypothetical protein